MVTKRFWICLTVAYFMITGVWQNACAGDWAVTLWGGPLNIASFGDTVTGKADYQDSYIAALAVSKRFDAVRQYFGPVKEHLDFELEGQFVQHFNLQDHCEVNGLFVLRWLTFPWNGWIETSFAAGEGFSFALERPELEAIGKPDTPRLLNYVLFELTFSLPEKPDWSLVARLHHRSGIFGLIHGKKDASNAVGLGIRHRF